MAKEQRSPSEGGKTQTLPGSGGRKSRRLHIGVLLVAAVLIGAVLACTSNTSSSKEPQAATGSSGKKTAPPQSVVAGKQLYQQHCSTCHGPEGNRMPVAPLQSKDFLETRGDATLLLVVSEGKGSMQAWGKARGGPLTEGQIQNVVAYLNFAAGRESSSVKAGAGQAIFTTSCARCHGESGDRIPIAPLNVKGFLDTRSDDSLATTISDGKGQMPGNNKSKGGQLSDDQIKDVVAFLRNVVETNVAASAALGRETYVSSCLGCHGEKGDRVPGVSLASLEFLTAQGDGKLISTIGEGTSAMPGFGRGKGGALDPSDLGAILSYLKAWAGTRSSSALPLAGPPSEAKDLFVKNCAPCHGETGDKVSGAQLRSKTFLQQKGDVLLKQTISRGNAKGMPAWSKSSGGPFSDEQISGLVSYLNTSAGITGSSTGASGSSAPSAPGGASIGQLVTKGKELFAKNCVACHGETRDRVPTCKLADKAWVDQKSDAAFTESIANGKGGMPAWGKAKGGQLSDEDIQSLILYLRDAVKSASATGTGGATSSSGSSPTASTASAALSPELISKGKDVFAKNCTACHGETRDKVPTCKLADKDWVTQKGEAGLTKSVADGKGGMPAWAGKLSNDEIKAVVGYLLDAVGAGGGGSASPSSAAPTSAPAGGAISPELIAKGKDVFGKNCTACHGETRDRIPTCKLADKSWVEEKGDTGLTNSIANGKGGMPAWSKAKGGQLSDDDIKALVGYLKDVVGIKGGGSTTAAASAPAGGSAISAEMVSKGKDVFGKNCTACHGETRDKVPTCKLADKDWVTQKGEAGLTKSVADGKGGMPAWAGKLSNDEIKAVVGYLLDAVGAGGGGSAGSASGGSSSTATPPSSSGGSAGSSGSSASAQPAAAPLTTNNSTTSVSAGKDLYTKNCLMCHGADGLQQKACPLGSKEWVQNTSQEGLRARITNGKPAAGMPTWGKAKGGSLSDDEIGAIMMYIGNELAR